MRVRSITTLLALAILIPVATPALAQDATRSADSLLHVADSIRALGQRAGADSALVRLRLARALSSTPRTHAAMADAFAGIFSLRRTDRWAYDSALAHADSALALDPRNVVAMYARASALGSAGDVAGRLSGYERALAADSLNPRVVGLLISAYHDGGRSREAMALGERMQLLQPRNRQAQFRLGWTYGYLWDQDRATAVFERLANDSGAGVYRAWGHGELAYLARARGDLAGAVRHMEDAARVAPNDLTSRLGLAMMLLTAGDAARAQPLIESGLARDSNATGYGSFPGRLLLAWAARDNRDSALARRMFADTERALKANEAAGNAQWTFVAGTYALQDRRREALAALAKANGGSFYGGPDPRDGSLASLTGDAEYQAIMARGRATKNERRVGAGLPSWQ